MLRAQTECMQCVTSQLFLYIEPPYWYTAHTVEFSIMCTKRLLLYIVQLFMNSCACHYAESEIEKMIDSMFPYKLLPQSDLVAEQKKNLRVIVGGLQRNSGLPLRMTYAWSVSLQDLFLTERRQVLLHRHLHYLPLLEAWQEQKDWQKWNQQTHLLYIVKNLKIYGDDSERNQ